MTFGMTSCGNLVMQAGNLEEGYASDVSTASTVVNETPAGGLETLSDVWELARARGRDNGNAVLRSLKKYYPTSDRLVDHVGFPDLRSACDSATKDVHEAHELCSGDVVSTTYNVSRALVTMDWQLLDRLNMQDTTRNFVVNGFPHCSQSQIAKIVCHAHALLSAPSGQLRRLAEHWAQLDFDACLLWDRFIEGEVDEATPVFVAAMVLQRLARAHVRSCGQSGTDTACV